MIRFAILLNALLVPIGLRAADCRPLHVSRLQFEHLPDMDSSTFARFVKEAAAQFKTQGYAVIDLSKFITAKIGKTWFESLPHKTSSQIFSSVIYFNDLEGRAVEKGPTPWHLKGMENLDQWLAAITARATGGVISQKRVNIDIRLGIDGDQGVTFNEWHVDGGSVNFLVALHGPGAALLGLAPQYKTYMDYEKHDFKWDRVLKGKKEIQVPRGHALIFFGTDTALDGQYPTLVHKSPDDFKERVLFIGRHD